MLAKDVIPVGSEILNLLKSMFSKFCNKIVEERKLNFNPNLGKQILDYKEFVGYKSLVNNVSGIYANPHDNIYPIEIQGIIIWHVNGFCNLQLIDMNTNITFYWKTTKHFIFLCFLDYN